MPHQNNAIQNILNAKLHAAKDAGTTPVFDRFCERVFAAYGEDGTDKLDELLLAGRSYVGLKMLSMTQTGNHIGETVRQSQDALFGLLAQRGIKVGGDWAAKRDEMLHELDAVATHALEENAPALAYTGAAPLGKPTDRGIW